MAIRLPSKTDADDGSSKEWGELRPKWRHDEFIPRGAIAFGEFRDWLGKAMFPDDWTGEECAGWFPGSFGQVHRSEAERDADLERRHAESAKQHELSGRPVPDAELDSGIDDTGVWPTLTDVPLTPEQRAEIDRKLEPLYRKALAVKHRREMVETELQQIFWNGTLGAFYISQDDGRKMDIAPNDWGVKRRRGKFYSEKTFLHQTGFFHVDVSGERREFTILIDAEEAKTALSTYRDCKTTLGGRAEATAAQKRQRPQGGRRLASQSQTQKVTAQGSEPLSEIERDLKERAQAILEEGQRIYDRNKHLGTRKIALIMVRDGNNKKFQGWGDETVRRILDGRYKPAIRLGLKGLGLR